jgi:acyl-coenzyme A synthetase/AMP-(fatty) acid ligase
MSLPTLHPQPHAAAGAAVPDTGSRRLNAAALLLEGHDARHPALVCHGGESLDYGELRERVARTAACWRAHGVVPGDRVAIKLPDSADWVVAFLGAIWCGAIAVGVNPQVPAADWHYILGESGFKLIVVDDSAADEADNATPEPWRERLLPRAAWRASWPLRATAGAADGRGRTGGVVPFVGHFRQAQGGGARDRFARRIEQVSSEGLGLRGDDRVFASSRLFFSYPQTNSLYAGLKLGLTIILDAQWPSAESVAATVAAQLPSVLFSVPSLYRNLLHAGLAPGIAAAGVRLCVSAGEALPASLREAWREQTGLTIVNGYGASETLVLVMIDPGQGAGFAPSPGIDIEAAREAGAGQPTRLLIRAPTLSIGYFDRPQAQSEHFRDGRSARPICSRDALGGWRFAGREDSLVKIHGRWVNLVELEERFARQAPTMAEGAAVCVPDADGVDAVAFFFVASDSAAVEAALRATAEAMPPHQRPRWLHRVDALPRTATGKLLRRKLQEMHAGQS